MLSFAAIAPHALNLLKNRKKYKATVDALATIAAALQREKPDILLVLSPHGTLLEKGFTVNLAQTFETDLHELGVEVSKHNYKSDPLLTMEIKKRRENNTDAPVMLVSSPKLDYGTAVSLDFLTIGLKECTIIPVNSSLQALKDHYLFGDVLKEVVMSSQKRFVVVASAGLAHGKGGGAIDEQILSALTNDKDFAALADTITPDTHKKFEICGLGALLMLGGVLRDLPWQFTKLAYEKTEDEVGMLTGQFTLKS